MNAMTLNPIIFFQYAFKNYTRNTKITKISTYAHQIQ